MGTGAIRANVKTAEDATTSPQKAFHTAVFGGSIMGFSITGFSVIVLSLLYALFRKPAPLIGFGASLAALFAQIGGGIYTSAALLGPFFNNLGTAFDNAKKIIEDTGNKGSFEHQAAVAADTVGDPMKDVAGPSLLIFMKLVGMAALLMASIVR